LDLFYGRATPAPLLFIGLLVLLRRGQVRLVAWVCVLGIWLILTLGITARAGIYSPSLSLYLLPLLLAMLLLGLHAGIALAVVTLLLELLLAVTADVPADSSLEFARPVWIWTMQALALSIMTWLYALATGTLRQALTRARHGEAALVERNRDLEREISERELAEAALRRSEEKFRTLVEHSLTGIYINDDQFHLIYANERLAQLLGYPLDQLIGMDYRELLTDDSREQVVDRYLRRQRDEAISPRNEFDIVRGDGAIRQVEITVSAFRDPDGNIHTMGQLVDVTQRERARQQEMELTLEREKAGLMRDLIGDISHDLKNPITTIETSLYLMERAHDDDRRREKMDSIREQTGILIKLIQNLITITRLDYTPNLQLAPTDMNGLLSEIARNIQPMAEAKQLRLLLELDQTLGRTLTDADEMRRALVNLVDNAVNYTPPSRSVTLRSALLDDCISAQVIDEGIGIPPADLKNVFKPYFRTDEARGLLNSGSGLGLAIVKKIIEMHGGTITVSSEPGVGTTFVVLLPMMPKS
jgi:PAS domain S-box-containing protein